MYLVLLPTLLDLLGQWLTSCSALVLQNVFATSSHYTNSRMFTSKSNFFNPLSIAKVSLPWATMTCATLCGHNESCLAFNICETESSYVCELLPDNLCQNSSTLALTEWPGCSIWDRVTPTNTRTCIETRFSSMSAIPCNTVKPGCLGYWPNCSNCVQNCFACKQRYAFSGDKACTFWPDGDTSLSEPIFGLCYYDATYFIKRNVDQITGAVTIDYRMPLEDWSRVVRQGIYSQLEFYFQGNTASPRRFRYKNPSIDAQGTLSNVTFFSGSFNEDILKLNGQKLQPTSFTTVNDDLYGCGSFWLFDTKNGTYCPGGRISMLGTPKTVKTTRSTTVSTGVRIDSVYYAYCSLALLL